MKPSPIPPNATIGLCIATHGSPSYVALGLEALKRNEPDCRVLIHDDSSDDKLKLMLLAEQYGADFVSTLARLVPTVGDLSAFVEALRWGEREGLDIVVKCSRRFIINRRWCDGLRELMHSLQYATACAPCSTYGFGYRSELVAMAVRPWIDSGAMAKMAEAVRINQRYDSLPEAYDHHRARDVHRWVHPRGEEHSHASNANHPDVDYLVRSENSFQRPDNYAAYAWWPLMGLARQAPVDGTLWHDIAQPHDYHRLSDEFDLPYSLESFVIVPGE